MFGRDMIELPTSRFSISVGWVDDKTLLVDVRVEDMCLKAGKLYRGPVPVDRVLTRKSQGT